MRADEKEIESIIEGKRQYVVPLFQRAYVWEKKHWQTLWDDLIDLASSNELNENHFFGSFVTMPLEENKRVNQFLLIDGQQRLTTIFLLLAIIRNEAESKALTPELADGIKHDYLFNTFRDGSIKLRLTKLQGDEACFEQIIRGKECTIDNRIKDAFSFFSNLVSKTTVALQTLTQVITRNLRVVHLELDKGDDPYKIFESLNAKGEELSQADLIRNYFFMRIDEELVQEHYDAYWQPIQQKLGDNLSEYMRHYSMKDGAMVKKNEVYFTLKKRNDKLKTSDEVVNSLKDLAKFANYYEKLLYPVKEKNPGIRERIFRLNQIEITVAYPFVLNLYAGYENKPQCISESQFTEILDLLENFLVRRFICKVPTHGLNKIFPYLYGRQYDDFVEGVKGELSKQKYPENSKFVDAFKTVKLYDGTARSRKKAKLLLGRLDGFQNKELVNVNHSDITIEHVMPQKLTPEWKEMLGDDWQTIHQTLCDTIGNLTLSGYNPRLARLEFYRKKEILQESNFRLNRYFANLSKWDEEAIRKRADSLAQIALKIWPYFGEAQTDSNLTAHDMRVAEAPTDSNLTAHDMTGRKALAVIIMGHSYPVSYWREVMQKTLEVIIDRDADAFKKITEKFPKYVAAGENNFRSPRELSKGAYIETNLSAQSIYKFCREVIEFSGLPSRDWQVKLVN